MTDHLKLDKEQKDFLKYHTFAGNEIVAGTRWLAFMNLLYVGLLITQPVNFLNLLFQELTPASMDSKYVLTSEEEPTDVQLNTLMKEVAAEAVEKAAIAKKQLKERIAQEVEKAKSRYQAMHTL